MEEKTVKIKISGLTYSLFSTLKIKAKFVNKEKALAWTPRQDDLDVEISQKDFDYLKDKITYELVEDKPQFNEP